MALNSSVKTSSFIPKSWWAFGVWSLLILALALPQRVLSLGQWLGPDERFIWELTSRSVQALLSGNWGAIGNRYPGLTLMWLETLNVGLRYGWAMLTGQSGVTLEALLGPDQPFSMLAEKRLVLSLTGAGLVVVWYWLVRRSLGPRIGFVAALLAAWNPFCLAEIRLYRIEGLMAGLAALTVVALWPYWFEDSRRYLVLSAVLAGLATATKITAVVLLPYAGLLVLTHSLLRPVTWSGRFKTALKDGLLFLGVALLTFWLLWPGLWVNPVGVFADMYEYVFRVGLEGFEERGVFFLGQVYPNDPGPLFYPVAALFRLTIPACLGIIAALIFLGRYTGKTKALWLFADPTPTTDSPTVFTLYWSLIWSLGFVLVFGLALTLGALKIDRYLLPAVVVLDGTAAIGLAQLAAWLGRPEGWLRRRCSERAINLGLILGLILLVVPLALREHPYYYSYFNPLLGGAKGAVKAIPVGIGEGIDQAMAYLNALPQAEQLMVACANSQKCGAVFKGRAIGIDNLSGKWMQADQVMLYISQAQQEKHSADILTYLARHQPERVVTLGGLEYAWLYPGPSAQYYGGGFKLEGRGTLFGYSLLPSPRKGEEVEIAAGDTLPVTLYWRNEGQLESDRFFVRLMDVDGYVWAEAIARPRPGFEAASRTENEIVESEAQLTLPVGMPPGDYFFKPGFRTDSGEIVGYFELPDKTKPIQVMTAKTYPPLSDFKLPHPAQLTANQDLKLLGYSLETNLVSPGSSLWATLYWGASAEVSHDYVILLRLVDEKGQELAYWLGRPVRSGYPTTEWRSGQIVQDPWQLQIPPDAPAGVYQFEAAIFDAESQAELARTRLGELTVSQ